MRYAQECNRGRARDDDEFKDFLRDAIRAAPCRPGGNVEHPYCQDFYLQSLIDGAFALLSGDPEIQSMRPHHEAATDTLAQAEAALAEHAAGFFDRALRWNALDEEQQAATPAEHSALVVGVGAGKTFAARAALPAFIAASEEAGQPHRLLWSVPTHKLGGETLEEMHKLGINAAIMRGRDAIVPGTAGPGDDEKPERMCLNLEAVEDALSIHAKVEKAVCGNPKKGPCCPWRKGPDQCAFQRQKGPVGRADVVIIPHQSLFFELVKEARTDLAAAIVDESWWQAGLSPHREVHLDSFAQEPLTYPVRDQPKKGDLAFGRSMRNERNDESTNDLHVWSTRAQAAFTETEDGAFPSREAFIAAGLTAANCASAYALEWRRMYEDAIYPGQPAKERRKALALAAGNAGIPRRAAIWRALQELLNGSESHTGRLQMGTRTTASGSLRVIVLHTRMEIRDEISRLPMLHLDATMPMQVVKHYLPRIELLAAVNPVAPHMDVRQVVGGWGKTSLVPSDKAAPDENRRRENLVREIADFASLNCGGDALVVTYEAIEPVFAERPGIRTGHFNAIAGLDGFKDVRSLFVIGRPLPNARELRETALALTGRPIPEESGRVETRGALLADGTGAGMNVRSYSDPDMEALRVAITEAEIIQAVGRGRGVRRTAANPLSVFLFADVATALPITRMCRWADIRPGVVARMRSRGLVLSSPADAARIYPDLFPSPKAAEHAFSRARSDFPPNSLGIHISLGEWGGNRLVQVSYRPEGRGQQKRTAWVVEDRLATLEQFLTEQLEVRVRVEPVQPNPDPTPPRPPDRPTRAPPLPDDEFSPYPDQGQPGVDEWTVPSWATDLEERAEASETATEERPSGRAPRRPTCDVPWLHPDVPAVLTEAGQSVIVCPFCGEQHRHHGFGHRLAHCRDPQGRGYVLVRPAGLAPLVMRGGVASMGP